MHIYVDADAVVDIIEDKARKYKVSVTLLCDTNHVLSSAYSEVMLVGAGADAVDYKLISICHKGDIVGVKGRLQTSVYEDDDNNKKYGMDVVAEKITFLSSGNKKEELNQDNSSS